MAKRHADRLGRFFRTGQLDLCALALDQSHVVEKHRVISLSGLCEGDLGHVRVGGEVVHVAVVRLCLAHRVDLVLKRGLAVHAHVESGPVAAASVEGEGEVVRLAVLEFFDKLRERGVSLQESDAVLLRVNAVVGKRPRTGNVDAVVAGRCPATDGCGLDVAGEARRAAGLEAGVDHGHVVYVALGQGDTIEQQRGVPGGDGFKNQLARG